MKIALISPKRGNLFSNKELEQFFWSSNELRNRAEGIYRWPELGLLTLAALMPREWDICYKDDNFEEIDYEEKYDIVAITALTPKATRAYEIADNFRKRGAYVIMGGPHVSVMIDEALEHADTIFIGEAQILWESFEKDYLNGQPNNVYNGENKFTDMEKSPIPRYDLLDFTKYKVIPIETTRGCPHDCEFCSSTKLWGKTFRKKTVVQIIKEIETIKKYGPDKYLFFVDDNMFVNREFSYKLLTEMAAIKNLRWFTQTDISISKDIKLLELMFMAGCREVLIGFETISSESLKKLDSNQWKYKQIKHYPEAIKTVQSMGISIYGSFIIGLEDDTEDSFNALREFLLTTKIIGYQILVLTPIPGTRIYSRYLSEDRLIKNQTWGNYSTYQLNHVLKKMTKEQFEKEQLKLFKEVYSEKSFISRKKHYVKYLKNREEYSRERTIDHILA